LVHFVHLRRYVFLQKTHVEVGISGPAHIVHAKKTLFERFFSSIELFLLAVRSGVLTEKIDSMGLVFSMEGISFKEFMNVY